MNIRVLFTPSFVFIPNQKWYRSFEFPCNDETEATILYDVLRVDKEPKRSSVEKKLSVVNNVLHM